MDSRQTIEGKAAPHDAVPRDHRNGDIEAGATAPRAGVFSPAACLAFVIAAIAVVLVWAHTLRRPDQIGYGLNHYSEWLVNYAGGFVRRGLAGEIVHRLAAGGPAIGIVNHLVLGIFAVLAAGLSLLLALTTRRLAFVALAMLAPGSILAMAIGNDYYYRKEVLFHVHLVIVGLLVVALGATRDARTKALLFRTVKLFVVIGTVVLPWVHETFIFLSLPAHLLLLHLAARHLEEDVGGMVLGLAVISVGIFVVEALFKGGAETSRTIWHSLHLVDRTLINPTNPDQSQDGGIGAIAWTLKRALGDVVMMLVSGYAWFWLVPFSFVTACVWLVCRLAAEERGRPPAAVYLYFDYYLLIVLGTLPLFVLATDWGRWISSSFIGFLVVLLARLRLERAWSHRSDDGREAALSLSLARAAPRALAGIAVPAAIAASLLVKMPECCIIGYDNTLLVELKRLLAGK